MREKLNLLTTYFKKYWMFILIALIAAVLIAIKFLYTKPQVIPKNNATKINAPQQEIIGTKFSGNLKLGFNAFPQEKKLPYYTGIKNSISEGKALEIANYFGFKLEPNINEDLNKQKTYVWTDDTRYLIIELSTPRIYLASDLMNNPDLLPITGNLPTKDEAIIILSTLYPQLNLTPKMDSLTFQYSKYFEKTGPVLKETSIERASLIEVGFVQKIDKYPLLDEDPEKATLRIVLDKNKNIVQFEDSLYFQSFSVGQEYNLKDQNEVKDTLKDEGKIVWVEGYSQGISEAIITSGDLDQIQIVFLQPKSDFEKILPVFLIKGSATISQRLDKLDLYLPAFSSN